MSTMNFQMFNLVLEKAEESEIKLPISTGSSKKKKKKQESSKKNPIYFYFIDYAKAFWEYPTTWSASWEICMQIRNQQLQMDMENQTGSK